MNSRRSVAAKRGDDGGGGPLRYKAKMFDGRDRSLPVISLQTYMRAYGRGSEGAAAREAFAKRVGTSLQYMVQLGLGMRRASVPMAVMIEQASHGLVRCEELNTDVDWHYLSNRVHRPFVPPVVVPPAPKRKPPKRKVLHSKRKAPPPRRPARPPAPPERKPRRRTRVAMVSSNAAT